MKKRITKLVTILLPGQFKARLVHKIDQRNNNKFLAKLKNNINSYYKNIPLDEEKEEILNYLKDNKIDVFPYEFSKKYNRDIINVHTDETNGLKYVMHEGKKLYFKRSMSEISIKSLYQGLQLDQDPDSPHLYLTENFNLSATDVIADIGAAEGNFSLSNIEKVKKIYLFESDVQWIEALEATFKPWKEKIQIVNKFVTNFDSDSTLNMNTFYQKNRDISFFKVDIEGEEQNFLNACEGVFNSDSKMKMAICTYHKQRDEKDFTEQLQNWGFEVNPSRGYMIFIHDRLIEEPYLRRGLLRVQK